MLSVGELRDRAFEIADGRKCVNPRADRELRFGNKGSLRVTISGPKAGMWHDYESGDTGTLLNRDERPEYRHIEKPRGRRVEHDPERLAKLLDITSRLVSLDGTPAERYLRSRSITKWPHAIRFDPKSCALACTAQDAAGTIQAVQRVFLTKDGCKRKIKVDGALQAKITNMAGQGWPDVAAARFPGRGEPIIVEGPETGLSIWLATDRPVFATLGNAGFDRLYIRGKRVTIAADGDEPNSPAAHRLKIAVENRERKGFRVKIARPPVGLDFNDIHQKDSLDAVKSIIKAAQ